jgi:RNA polymerase-binding transcription factor DksA
MADPTNETNPTPPRGLIPNPEASEREQILGTGVNPRGDVPPIDPKWQRFYDKLVELRDHLIDASGDLQQKAREAAPDPVQQEPSDSGTEEFQRDQLLGTLSLDQVTLAEVQDALSRIEDGTYGICQQTGQPIPEARLEAVPWTRFTVEAQQELEDRNEAPKAGIGALGDAGERRVSPPGPPRLAEGGL